MLGGEPATVDRAEADVLAGLAGATASRSMRVSFEATAANASKEQALEAVLERLGVAPEQVIAAGDADNDLGMLRMAGFAIVPSDAMARPRAAADLVVGPHDADGGRRVHRGIRGRSVPSGHIGAPWRPTTPPPSRVGSGEVVGSGAVSSSEDDLAAHSYDAWPIAAKWRMQHRQPFRPDLVVRPTTIDQVSRLLTWASEHGEPVTPWGLGSSVTGSPLPMHGGITLDLSSMRAVLQLDETRTSSSGCRRGSWGSSSSGN